MNCPNCGAFIGIYSCQTCAGIITKSSGHAGVVIDDSYWEAIKNNSILKCIEAFKKDALTNALKKNGWIKLEGTI